ncbi:hypothetical protein [Vreelandella titanicae]
MSIQTEKTYIYWIRFFIRYNHCLKCSWWLKSLVSSRRCPVEIN